MYKTTNHFKSYIIWKSVCIKPEQIEYSQYVIVVQRQETWKLCVKLAIIWLSTTACLELIMASISAWAFMSGHKQWHLIEWLFFSCLVTKHWISHDCHKRGGGFYLLLCSEALRTLLLSPFNNLLISVVKGQASKLQDMTFFSGCCLLVVCSCKQF